MGKQLPFLQPDPEQIRHQVRGVLDSYSHDWDLLAELAQNAVDAIARQKPVKGHITIDVDAPNRTISFLDNGGGIDPDNLPRLLRPFGSDKMRDPTQIGQKGVGLTFAIFSTSWVEIESHHLDGSCRATVNGARSWIDQENDQPLLIDLEEIEPAENGLRIRLKLADQEHPLWDLTHKQIEFVLRTRTALGNTASVWEGSLNCDFKLSHTDKSGDNWSAERECEYMLPTECVPDHGRISLEEFETWLDEGDRGDTEKRRKLKDKILFTSGKKNQAGRTINYWACFVPNRAFWRSISDRAGLIDAVDDDGVEGDEAYSFGGGLVTSTKGMPTGISLELKPRGSAGYVPNFFVLIEDPSLGFDIGRKSIHGRQQGMLRDIAYERFREFISIASKYIGGSAADGPSPYDREELIEEIKGLPDLDSPASAFVKRPNDQEATVAAMFFEQLGQGKFGGFEPYISGYRAKYDLFGRIGKKSFSVEFKFGLRGLFRDFTDERKLFSEIDVVVLWDLMESDWKEAAKRGLSLQEVKSDGIVEAETRFPVVHYQMFIDGSKPIEIVCMRRILKPESH
ncbi:ATP-binding protein [Erythrobacter sp. NFXS35]|uniref:ATP-binding protein n=1 Tax=Erythrobacter sp. NFXS35 TaxID=2818436 RepID=UPI0032DF1834